MKAVRFFAVLFAILLATLLLVAGASADALRLPGGLKIIEAEAFRGDTSLDNNLCELILADPMFMISKEEMDAIMAPENFIGRCPQQVDEFIAGCVKPVLEANGVSDDKAEINV